MPSWPTQHGGVTNSPATAAYRQKLERRRFGAELRHRCLFFRRVDEPGLNVALLLYFDHAEIAGLALEIEHVHLTLLQFALLFLAHAEVLLTGFAQDKIIAIPRPTRDYDATLAGLFDVD